MQNLLITIGDVNGDGFDDIVTSTTPIDESVTVYFGNGTRYFTPGPTSPSNCFTCDAPYGLLADFNGDGRPDLLGTSEGGVFIMLGNGDGTFQPATLYPSSPGQINATDIALTDLNGDGKPDFVAASFQGVNIFISQGNGDFSFSSIPLTQGVDQLSKVQLGDLNGDGIPDIVFAGINGVEILLGDGAGHFTLGQVIPVGDCYALTIGDLNGDGKLDLVVGSTELYRLFGKGDGTFSKPIAIRKLFSRPGRMQIADFNGDGYADLAVSGVVNFYLYYGNGSGLLSDPQVYTVGGEQSGQLAAGHFRPGDQLDVAVYDFFGFSVLFSTPHGFEDTVDTPVPLYPTWMTAADINGDGLTDLVVTGASEFQVFFGTGKASKPFVRGPATTLAGEWRIATADFNRDGKLDVVVSTL